MPARTATIYSRLSAAMTAEEEQVLGEELRSGGYSLFSELLLQFKEALTACTEQELPAVREALAKGKRLVPEPGAISPSWEQVWHEHELVIANKEFVLKQVPAGERRGEWQIVMDNPYTNEGIACYPALSFVEAAYLYAYFRGGLKKTEYLRLQKIVTLIEAQGE